MFRIFRRCVRDAAKSFIRNFSLSVASILCTTITLLLVSVAIIFAANIETTNKRIEEELSIIVYLKEEVTEEDIKNIEADIKSNENVTDVIGKTKDEWKLEMQSFSETFETVLDYLDENPLLDSFIVKVKDAHDLKKTADYIESIVGVETVKYGEGMVEDIISIFDVVEKIVVIIVIALVIVTGFLISNTIKLTIFSRRTSIEIMRLVGSSNIAIKLPFIIEGFFIGIIGSIVPVCVTIYGYVILYTQLGGHIFTNMITLIKPYNFVFMVAGVLVVLGALVGMYGSLKAVRKYLKI